MNEAVGPVVLVIEDEGPVRRFLRTLLGGHGFRVVEAATGAEGLAQATTRNPDLVLVDLGLPDEDGLAIVRKLRQWATMPILVISARTDERQKVIALDDGADDYIDKPFGADELLARIRVALRHAAAVSRGIDEPVVAVGRVRVDLDARRVFRGEEEVHLTPTEYKLLTVLLKHRGKVVTHRQLLLEVWGPTHETQSDYLRVYMRQLRHKLEDDPKRPRHFINEPGVGYRLRSEEPRTL